MVHAFFNNNLPTTMKTLFVIIFAFSALALGCQNDSTQPNSDRTSQINAFPKESISADELKGLLFMREEEKLARDVYTALDAKWNINAFSNIASSEQTPRS